MEKKNLPVLLAKIDSTLNLLQAMVNQYETQIPTIVARIHLAKKHLVQRYFTELFTDISWITKTILSRKALKKKFEHETLDLDILSRDLVQYLTVEPTTNLAEAISPWRKKILQAVESLDHDFLIITEGVRGLSGEIKQSFRNFKSVEKMLKDTLYLPSGTSEQEIISVLSVMTREVSAVNALLLSPGRIDPITAAQVQALRKVLLRDWNTLLQGMVNLFSEAYKETQPARKVRIVISRTGVSELSM